MVPDQSVPVTTLPMPRSVNERSTGRRAGPSAGRGDSPSQARSIAARRRSIELDVRDCGLHDLGPGERAVGEQLLHLGTCELGLDVVDQVPLAQRHDRALDSQELADRDVLARLRHHAVVAGDDDQREVDPGCPGDHRPDEALVTRDVDDGELPARGEHERCVAELDRDAASVLLGQTIRVDPGQRADEGRLAVVDVPCRAERQGGRAHRPGAGTSSASASVSVRQSSRQAPSAMRAITGGVPARSAAATASASPGERHGERRELGERKRASTDPARRSPRRWPPIRDARRSARARTISGGSSSARSAGIAAIARDGSRYSLSVASSAASAQAVDPQRPRERVSPAGLDRRLATGEDARLRSSEQLVARERHEIGSGCQHLLRRRLVRCVEQRPGAEVGEQRHTVLVAQPAQLGEARRLREPDHAVVRGVHPEDRRRLGPDRALVVGPPRPVRRTHLDEASARLGEHVGDPEPVADLDELTARHDDLAPGRMGGEREKDRRRPVVDAQRCLAAEQLDEQRDHVRLA